MTERRAYRREPEDRRRDALVAATLDLVAEGGLQAATVRAIADRAGVTPGLIRHYFQTKDDLVAAAYQQLMDGMTRDADSSVASVSRPDPVARLSAFVLASLRPPVVDERAVGLWAGFIHAVRRDPAMRAIHARTYLGFRDQLQALIAGALGRPAADPDMRACAIACNAVIDGLWLEGSALPEGFAPGEVERIGLRAVGAILGMTLPVPETATATTGETA
jgi:AcrR family transcriptional regulator